MHRDVGRTGHQPSLVIEEGAGEIKPLTDVPRAASVPQAGTHLLRDGSEAVVAKLLAKWIGRFNIGEIVLGPIPLRSSGVGRIAIAMIRIVMIEHRIPGNGRELSGRRPGWDPKERICVVGPKEHCFAAGRDERGCVACCGEGGSGRVAPMAQHTVSPPATGTDCRRA